MTGSFSHRQVSSDLSSSIRTATIISRFHDDKSRAIVLGTTLRDRHHHRLMVPGRNHGAGSVYPVSQTARHLRTKKPLSVAHVIDAPEEDEIQRVGRRQRPEAVEPFDHDVAMPNHQSIFVEVLGSCIVTGCRVGLESDMHVARLNQDVECGVGNDSVPGLRLCDDAADHSRCRGNFAHRNAVTGPVLQLLAVCQGLPDAEVDKVRRVTAPSGLATALARSPDLQTYVNDSTCPG